MRKQVRMKGGRERGKEGGIAEGKQRTFARYSLGISVMLKARAIHGTYSKQKTNQGKGGIKR